MEPNNEAPGGSNLFSPIEGTTDGFGIKLDSIFEEVEKNLPSIDFDISDVSSDEEVAIFHRTIKTPTFDEDKDLDESLTSESWEELLRAADTPDNDIMAHLQHGDTSVSKGQLTSPTVDSEQQELSERQSYSGLSLVHAEDSVSTLSLRSIREVDIEADIDTVPSESGHVAQPGKTQCMGTNTTDMSVATDIKINTWVGSDSIPDTSLIGGGSQKQSDDSHSERIGSDNKMSDKNIAPPGKPSDLVSRYIPSQGPSLTFQDLDNIDLDAALSMHEGARPVSLPLPRTTAAVRAPARPSPTPTTSTGRTVMQADDDENISLIEKLARLTVAQSGQAMREYDPNTGAVAQPDSAGDFRQPSPPEQDASKVAEGPNKSMNTKAMKTAHNKNMEAQQKSFGAPPGASDQTPPTAFSEALMMQFGLGGPAKKPKKERSRETVYIDLRHFDMEKHQQQLSFEAVQRILRLPPQSQPEESSSDEEDVGAVGDLSLWHAQRRKMKEALREGKNIAHPESYNTEKSVEAAKPTKPGQPKKGAASQREPGSPQKAAAATQQSAQADIKTPDVGAQGDSQSKTETGKPPISTAAQVEKERQKRIEAAKKAREARAAEHQSRVRLGQRLEALRPTTTVNERHPAAEATPVVFDLEASYEPALENLPTDLVQEREVLLLTVHMACNGEIVLHRGSANRSVDTGHGLSASYTTLVTWIWL